MCDWSSWRWDEKSIIRVIMDSSDKRHNNYATIVVYNTRTHSFLNKKNSGLRLRQGYGTAITNLFHFWKTLCVFKAINSCWKIESSPTVCLAKQTFWFLQLSRLTFYIWSLLVHCRSNFIWYVNLRFVYLLTC